MYVLEATKETQGKRDDDYVWTIDRELVFVPLTGDCDPRCGRDLGFTGTTSSRATTIAIVTDRPVLDDDTYRMTLFDAMCEQGYDIVGEQLVMDHVDDMVDTVHAIGTTLGAGTVIERPGLTMSVRRVGAGGRSSA